MNLNELFKRKSVQVGFAVFSILFGVYSVYGFVGLVRQTRSKVLIEQSSFVNLETPLLNRIILVLDFVVYVPGPFFVEHGWLSDQRRLVRAAGTAQPGLTQ